MARSWSEDALIDQLQSRLKTDHTARDVGLALHLARDLGSINTTEHTKSHKSKKRLSTAELAKRMVAEGHLAAAEQALAQPTELHVKFGLYEHLLVEQSWIEQLQRELQTELRLEPIVFSQCGRHATRTIIVELDNEEEGGKIEHRREVQYDLPPANGKTRWRDMHHEREKAALTKRFPIYRLPDGGQGEE